MWTKSLLFLKTGIEIVMARSCISPMLQQQMIFLVVYYHMHLTITIPQFANLSHEKCTCDLKNDFISKSHTIMGDVYNNYNYIILQYYYYHNYNYIY